MSAVTKNNFYDLEARILQLEKRVKVVEAHVIELGKQNLRLLELLKQKEDKPQAFGGATYRG